MKLCRPSALLIGLTLFAGCAASTPVTQHGRMREVLREGNTQPRISLVEVAQRPGAIGVGALAGLGGEVTVVDANVWIAAGPRRECAAVHAEWPGLGRRPFAWATKDACGRL